ncbi:hypothetical protein E2C01_058628 [Portunus trituberculatus]|uniref:Uncharacterized protein n=1 Tax=Portunus trituberculatus TaxID=210409 RepID=A0A5B7GW29_PORTR|nr:hypothetical protein [Portunus trituberculatus]
MSQQGVPGSLHACRHSFKTSHRRSRCREPQASSSPAQRCYWLVRHDVKTVLSSPVSAPTNAWAGDTRRLGLLTSLMESPRREGGKLGRETRDATPFTPTSLPPVTPQETEHSKQFSREEKPPSSRLAEIHSLLDPVFGDGTHSQTSPSSRGMEEKV